MEIIRYFFSIFVDFCHKSGADQAFSPTYVMLFPSSPSFEIEELKTRETKNSVAIPTKRRFDTDKIHIVTSAKLNDYGYLFSR